MLKIKVQGIYQSKNTNGVEEIEFEFIKNIPNIPLTWLNSMVQKRFLPFWIAEQNKKAKIYKPFSGISYCLVSEWEEVNQDDGLTGKDIMKMSEYEIQLLACKGLLTQVPLPNKVPLYVLREKAVLEYLKKIKKIPMKTEQDKERLEFFVKTPEGGYGINLIGKKCFVEDFTINPQKVSANELIKKITIEEITNNLPSQDELE